MFAKESNKKEQREDKGSQEENHEDEAQLVKLTARLTLQHEFDRMATARSENIVLEFEASSETMVAMDASKTAYVVEGERARKINGDQYRGHPEGKKPDAIFGMLAFRVATLVENQKMVLDTAVGALTEQHQDLAQRALLTVLNIGKQAENDRDMRAKRCFDERYKDGQKSCMRWILAVPADPEFMQAMSVRQESWRQCRSRSRKTEQR